MNRIVPVGDGTYVEVDENGTPVGAPYNPLETFGMLGGGSTGGTTTIGPDGKAIQAPVSAAPMAAAPPAGAAPVAAEPTFPESSYIPRASSPRSAPTNSGAYQGQQSYAPVAQPPGFGGTVDPFANIPNYQNGQRHPAAGGAPLTPGGIFAAQDDGYDNRQQVTSTSGASAGPFGVNAAPAPRQSAQGGGTFFNEDGFSGGGGGGGGSAAYQAIKAKGDAFAAKVRGMGGGGGTASSDGYTDPTKQYRRQGRRMDKAYERYNEELAEPDPMRVTGWSKEQGFKPGTIDALLDDPAGVLPNVFSGFEANERTRGIMDLPMTDLALMSFGTQGRDLMSRTPVVKPPRILRQNGVKPIKPEYKKSLDSSKVVNKIAEMYSTIGADPNHRFSSEALIGNLANADKHSAVRQGVEQQARFGNPGSAFDSIRSYINSAYDASMDDTGFSSAYKRGIDQQLRLMAPEFVGLKPKQADSAVNAIARRFL